MRRTVVLIGVLACAIVGVAVYGVQHSAAKTRANARVTTVPVAVATAEAKDFPISVNGVGTVQASGTVDVHAQVSGTLTKVSFTEGQGVKAGDLLAEIDARPYEAALQQAQAALAKDQAQLGTAQRDLARFNELSSKGFATAQQ